jgi:predicted transcriptional regulator
MEAAFAGTFVNAKEGVNVRNILNDMGHPQLKTSLLTDNLTTFGIISGKMKQRSKSIDMRFY